jgi:hypothetical protein
VLGVGVVRDGTGCDAVVGEAAAELEVERLLPAHDTVMAAEVAAITQTARTRT